MPHPKRKFYENHAPTPPTSATDLAWAAGFMDGEAMVTYRSGTAVASVSHCHLPTLQHLCDWFGGSIRYHESPNPRRKSVRPGFQWSVSGPHARAMLGMIRPFMREKRPQVDLILAEPWHKRGTKLTPEDEARRAELKRRLHELKRPRFYPDKG